MNALRRSPNVFMIDAQGIAHPNRCGCASHIGVKTGKPTVGVAQTRLFGFCLKDPVEARVAVHLTFAGEQIGWVLKSRMETRPIFVSPGHLVSMASFIRLLKSCLKGHKLPEPVCMAHKYANLEKVRFQNEVNEPLCQ